MARGGGGEGGGRWASGGEVGRGGTGGWWRRGAILRRVAKAARHGKRGVGSRVPTRVAHHTSVIPNRTQLSK